MTSTTWEGTGTNAYTLDLNGYKILDSSDNGGSSYTITTTGMKLTVKDSSTAADGQIDNLTLGVNSALTLESGWLGNPTVPNNETVTVSLQGGGLKEYTIRVPLAYVLSDGCYLFNTEAGTALSFDATPGASSSTFTVKRALTTTGGEKTGTMPYGRNKLPIAPTAAWTTSEAGTPKSITAIWYEWNGTQLTQLASAELTVNETGCTYGGPETIITPEAFANMTVGSTHDLYVELRVEAGDIRWRAAITGYQLTITKADLSDATITFPDGNERAFEPVSASTGAPKFTVTHNGKTLTEGEDYTVSGNTAGEVGAYQLTITAVEGSDYVGEKSAEWKVIPCKVLPYVGNVTKAYDGTTDLPENAVISLAYARTGIGQGMQIPQIAEGKEYEILNARYDSANASTEEKNISFTLKLLDKNFAFADGTMQKDFTVKGSETASTFKISKAAAPKMTVASALVVTNDQAGTYELTLPDLPTLKSPCEYGDVSYSVEGNYLVALYRDATTALEVVQESGQYKLKLTIDAVNTTDFGSAGTVRVKVTTANYQDITLDVGVKARNKLVPVGSPTLTPNVIDNVQ